MSKLSADKGIDSYETLVSEQKRLKELLKIQKQIIQDDIVAIKHELNPAVRVMKTINKFVSSDDGASPALRMGANATIDLALGRLLRSKPILKILVPAIVKNYTSHYVNYAVPILERIKEKLFRRRQRKAETLIQE